MVAYQSKAHAESPSLYSAADQVHARNVRGPEAQRATRTRPLPRSLGVWLL